jgi:hypothetical protein
MASSRVKIAYGVGKRRALSVPKTHHGEVLQNHSCQRQLYRGRPFLGDGYSPSQTKQSHSQRLVTGQFPAETVRKTLLVPTQGFAPFPCGFGAMINSLYMGRLCRICVIATCVSGSLLPILGNTSLAQVSGSGQGAKDEQKYSASLVVAPFSKRPNYLKYPDGRQQVIYNTESEYPAEDVLSFIRVELKKREWKPIPQDFFNPDMPSSHQRGWTFFEDHTQKPWTGVYAWNADWENVSHDITTYVLRYESPDNSTRNLKNLQVIALFIPAEIAAKMKRDGENFKRERKPKL